MQNETTLTGVRLATNWDEFVDVYSLLSPDEQMKLVKQAKYIRVERKLKKIIIGVLAVYIAMLIINIFVV